MEWPAHPPLEGGGGCVITLYVTPQLYPDIFITCFGYNKSKCKLFHNKIMVKIKYAKPGINLRVKGKLVIYLFRTQRLYDKKIIG